VLAWVLCCLRACWRLAVVMSVPTVFGAGSGWSGGEGGEGRAAAFAGFRGQPGGCPALVFGLPGVPCCEDRWLRTISRVVVNSISGARPIRRHQPRLMVLVAGSLAVAKPRSALVRRACE
jgi:hypothetical protein